MACAEWIQLAGPAATAFAAVVAGSIAVGIAIAQYNNAIRQTKIANDKVVLDLFEKRWKVYSAVKDVAGKAMTRGVFQNEDDISLCSAIIEAEFLFGVEVAEALKSMRIHLIDLESANMGLKNPLDNNRIKIVDKRSREFEWVSNFHIHIQPIFRPYLSATHRFSET